MATAIGDLVVRLGMDTSKFSRPASSARSQLGGFALAGAVAGTAAAILTTGIETLGRAFKNAATSGSEFNAAMRTSLAIMNVTTEQQATMQDAAFKTARQTGRSATDMAKSYYYLASAGYDAQQSVANLPQMAKFATAGNFDMARATELAADAQASLGMKVKDPTKNLENLTRVTDTLISANTLANASAEQFSAALTTKSGAAMRALGKDIEEGVAVLAVFADQGIKGEEAGTQFGIVLRDLQSKAIQNKTAFEAAGMAVYDSAGKMRGMADIVDNLSAVLGGMSDQARRAKLMQLGFSDKSLGSLQALLGTGQKIREYETQLRQSGGKTAEVAAKSVGALGMAWNSFTTSIQELGSKIMTVAGPVIGVLLVGITGAVDAINYAAKFIGNMFENLLPGMKDLGPEVVGLIRGEVEKTGSSAKETGSALKSAFAVTPVKALNATLADTQVQVRAARMEYEKFRYALDLEVSNTFIEPIAELTEKYREASEESRRAALGISDWQAALGDLQQRSGVSYMANAQRALAQAAQDAQKWDASANATKWMDETSNKLFEMTSGLDSFAVEFANLASAPGVTQEQLDRMSQMYKRFRELERVNTLKDFGKGITESVKTPMERAREELKKLNELRGLGEKRGGISEETYRRRTKEIGAELVPEGPRYSGAMEKGSAEAYSTIINSGKESDKIAKQQLTVEKAMAADMKIVASRFGNTSTVSIPV